MKGEKSFALSLRNPEWSKRTKASVNGSRVDTGEGYTVIERVCQNSVSVELELDMRTPAILPIPYV